MMSPILRYAPETPVQAVLRAVDGPLGALLMFAFALAATLAFCWYRTHRNDRSAQIQSVLLATGAALYLARLLIRSIYFDNPHILSPYHIVYERGLAMLLGSILLGIPAFVFGRILSRGLQAVLARLTSRDADDWPWLLPFSAELFGPAKWLILCISLGGFGYISLLPTIGCFLLGTFAYLQQNEVTAETSTGDEFDYGSLFLALLFTLTLGVAFDDIWLSFSVAAY